MTPRRVAAFFAGVAAVVVLTFVVIMLTGGGSGGDGDRPARDDAAAVPAGASGQVPPVQFELAPAAVGPPPADDSVDVGFGRDMRGHHAQAVQMSMAVREVTDDEAVRRLAYDIALTQQEQIGRMAGWLQLWGLPLASSRAPMQWMAPAMAGHTMAPPSPGAAAPVMPGMAAQEQLDRLAQLRGKDAEILFLTLMIAHHEGGVAMAEDAWANARIQQVRDLARTMVNGQSAEIALMRAMLAERGA